MVSLCGLCDLCSENTGRRAIKALPTAVSGRGLVPRRPRLFIVSGRRRRRHDDCGERFRRERPDGRSALGRGTTTDAARGGEVPGPGGGGYGRGEGGGGP